ncbi:MAG: hypothetical protein AAGE59_25220 [Cyanobacteria bacterium P01_F01_bin.86]
MRSAALFGYGALQHYPISNHREPMSIAQKLRDKLRRRNTQFIPPAIANKPSF